MEEPKKFFSYIINEMDTALMEIRMEWPKAEDWSKKSIPVLQGYLDKLKHHITEHPFKRRSEEIYFFKEVKPYVLGKLVFYVGVHNVEARRPPNFVGSSKASDHLLRELEYIKQFFEQHIDLYDYHTSGLEVADSKFFVRKVDDPFTFRELLQPIDVAYYYGDPDFSTPFDYLFAQFRGYEQLRDYISNEVETLLLMGDEIPEEELRFIGSSADFVELVVMFRNMVRPTDPTTGKLLTEEQIAEKLKETLNVDWGSAENFQTLKLITGSSDYPEQLLDKLEKLKKKWEEEEGDQEYGDGDLT